MKKLGESAKEMVRDIWNATLLGSVGRHKVIIETGEEYERDII